MVPLGAIPWENPIVIAAIIAAVGAVLVSVVKRITHKKSQDDGTANVATTVNPQITNAPRIEIDNSPTVNVGLDLHGVRQLLREELREQLAQLAPKQPVPDSEDRLKAKAVEFFNAGADAYREGEIGQTLEHCLDAVKLKPDDAYAHNNLADALAAEGKLDAAMEHWSEALRVEPHNVYAHNNLGTALAAKGRHDAAIEHWSEALRVEPHNAFAHNNLGSALAAKGELDGAMKHWSETLRVEPHNAFAHNNLGIALAAKGELDAAMQHWTEALRVEPHNATAQSNLGWALDRKKVAATAVAALAEAIELDPKLRDDAKSNTDYDPIRNDPAFRKLVYGE